MTKASEKEKHLRPGTESVVYFEETDELGTSRTYYNVENEGTQRNRMSAWHLIMGTIPEMEKSIFEGIAVGDVYGLFTMIKDYLGKGLHTKEVLDKEFKQFAYEKGELFKTFVMRYTKLRGEMGDTGLVMDDDLVLAHLQKVLTDAENENVTKVYLSVIAMYDEKHLTPKTILDAMQKQMNVLENHDKRVIEHSKSTKTSEERAKQKEKKQKWKERKKEEKARVNRATQKGAADDVRGVCLYYQTDSCLKTAADCKFKHEKLNDAKHEKLKQLVKQFSTKNEKNKQMICFRCKEPGHRASECPSSAPAASSKVRVTRTHDEIVSEVKGLSKEERARLLEDLLNEE